MPEPTKKTQLAEVILGGQDGLVNILGLTMGLTAAGAASRIIIVAGLAATFAESISMGAVVYTSRSAERNQYLGVQASFANEIEQKPDVAKDHLHRIYTEKGLKGEGMHVLIDQLTKNKDLWLHTLMTEGTELSPINHRDLIVQSIVTFVATLIGSLIPLTPFFFLHPREAVVYAVIVSGIVLFAVGAYTGNQTIRKPVKGGLQLGLIGLGAAFAGYLIGLLFKV